jgi:acyl-CoA reductase-like NAD-dependent aldehyde dehydrogenase
MLGQNFIDGVFVAPSTGKYILSINPATTLAFGQIPDSGNEDVDLAVLAATNAFQAWSTKSPQYRSAILTKIADLIQSQLEEFARAESIDQGKPIALARTVDIPRAIHNFRFFASSILHQDNICTHGEGVLNYVHKTPVGVCALISPWNLPLYLLTWKVYYV